MVLIHTSISRLHPSDTFWNVSFGFGSIGQDRPQHNDKAG
jgi:hypothetical protein